MSYTNDPIEKEIVTARIKMLLYMPFFGNLAVRLISVEAPWCGTAATDGKYFYWNREFIKKLSRPQLLFLIGHEVLHCAPSGTIIPGCFKNIEDIVAGDHVIGEGGKHSTVVAPMSRHYDGGMVTIKARGMLPLQMTTEHPVRVVRPTWKTVGTRKAGDRTIARVWSDPEWVNAEDVKRGDWVQIPSISEGNVSDYRFAFTNKPSSRMKIHTDVLLDEEIAEFLGYYVGWTNSQTSYTTSISLNLDTERTIAERLGLMLKNKFGISSYTRLNFSSFPLGEWLRENCGYLAHNIRIPNCILYNTPEILAAFLRGYTNGDGHVSNQGVWSETVSKVLILQLQLAWARFGVLFNIYDCPLEKNCVIRGKLINSGRIYRRIYRGSTSNAKAFEIMQSDEHLHKKRPTQYGVSVNGAIFTPVSKVSVEHYSGMVYNFETTCNTYAMGNMMTHNCVFDHLGRRGNRDPKIWNMACLAWNTPILMADGTTQPIQRILPGDYVASPFGPSKVFGNMFSGIKPTMEYGIGDRSIRATFDHRFASVDGFVEADSLVGKLGYFVDPASDHSGLRFKKFTTATDQDRVSGEQVFEAAIKVASNSLKGFVEADNQHSASIYRGMSELRLLISDRDGDINAVFISEKSNIDPASHAAVKAVGILQKAARRKFIEKFGDPEIGCVSWAKANADYGRFLVKNSRRDFVPVFDLITEVGGFFANGILTHNCDYNINYTLVQEKIGQMPETGLYDPKYTDAMSADEIYDLLKKNSVTIKMPLDEHLDLGNDSDSKDNQGDGDGDDPISRDGSNKSKGKKPGSGKSGQKSVDVTVMGKDGPPKLSEADLQKIRNDMKAAIIQTAQQVGAGKVPLGIKRLISDLVEPKLDWRSLLDAHIRSAMKDDYTFQRPSRRTWGTGVIMPAQNFLDRVEIWCAIDASGSTTQEMVTDFLSEVKGIMDSFRDYRIGILSFDTEVYNVYEFTPDNGDEILQYTIKGGGGTIFQCVYEYFKREGIEPNRLAFLTDGLPNDGWGDPNYCDTIFVIHSNPAIVPPYGIAAYYESDNQR